MIMDTLRQFGMSKRGSEQLLDNDVLKIGWGQPKNQPHIKRNYTTNNFNG